MPVGGDIEAGCVELRTEVCQLMLRSRFGIKKPKVLVLNLPSEVGEFPAPGKNSDVPTSPRKDQRGQRMGCAVRGCRLHGESGPDIRS